MKTLFAVGLLTASFSSVADSSPPDSQGAWGGARPNVQVNVTPGSAPDTCTVKATVSDMRT